MLDNVTVATQESDEASFIIVSPAEAEDFFSDFDMSGFTSFEANKPNHYAANIVDGTLRALAPLYLSGNNLNVSIVEVHPDFRGHKLGMGMVRDIFEFASTYAERACVSTQGFTNDGKTYLMPHMEELEAEFPDVSFVTYPGA